jgi:hypothetical protein
MKFYASQTSQRVVLGSLVDASQLMLAIHGVIAPGLVHNAALMAARRLMTASALPGTVHLRPLHGGGLELFAVLSGSAPADPVPIIPGITHITDQWEDDKGVCMLVRILNGDTIQDLPFGVMEQALGGAFFSGDAFALSVDPDAMTVLVIDGLGHGPLADIAARAGVEAMERLRPSSPADDLRVLHSALKNTVGAVAAIARFDVAQGTLAFSGVGNIEATSVSLDRRDGFASFPGVVGQRTPTFRTYRNPVEGKTHLVMHTDGLRANWGPAKYPGLFGRHPALIAGVLFRDCWRQSDDALIFVIELASRVHTALLHGPRNLTSA